MLYLILLESLCSHRYQQVQLVQGLCILGMSNTAKCLGITPQNPLQYSSVGIHCGLELLGGLDWMIALTHSNNGKPKTCWPFLHLIHFILPGTSVECGRSIRSHNSLAPPPHAGHQPGHILLWDGIPFLTQDLLKVNQRGGVGHSSMYITPPSDPTSVQLG